MNAKRSGTEADPAIIEALPSVESYIEKIRTAVPDRDADDEQVRALANLYRLRAYHEAVLEIDPSDSYSTDLYQKLSTLALRYEDALYGEKKARGRPPNERPAIAPIRRQ